MMSMAEVSNFQVRFGINDTPLTRALDSGDYERAYTIIEENASDPDFFNDGPYERIPLYIALCGREVTSDIKPRNLRMAKVLINHGADPNLHVPVFNPRWMTLARQFSQSPMELLLDFYVQSLHHYAKDRRHPELLFSVIGLDDNKVKTFPELQEQLLELLDCFIAHGAEVNVYLGDVPALVRLLFTYPDLELTEKLVQGGADVMLADSHGNTSLMALCRPNWKVQNKLRRDKDLSDILQYLIQIKSLDLNFVNCMNQSALWYTFCTSSLKQARMLIEAGADPSLSGIGYTPRGPQQVCPEILVSGRIPAFLMTLTRTINSSFVYHENWERGKLPFSVSDELSSLVDSGLLDKHMENLENSLYELFQWNQYIRMHHPMLQKLQKKKNFIIPSLLGKLSISVHQLCARTIFSCCVHYLASKYTVDKTWTDNKETAKTDQDPNLDCSVINDSHFETVPEDICGVPCEAIEDNIIYIKSLFMQQLFQITCQDLDELVTKLRLPSSFSVFLEFELYRWKILVLLANSHYDHLSCCCEDVSTLDSISDSDISANASSIELPEGLLFEYVDHSENGNSEDYDLDGEMDVEENCIDSGGNYDEDDEEDEEETQIQRMMGKQVKIELERMIDELDSDCDEDFENRKCSVSVMTHL